jgi:hypothetical protein
MTRRLPGTAISSGSEVCSRKAVWCWPAPLAAPTNTGIAIFEAADEESARHTVSKDPAAQGGYARGDLRPFELGLLRGRDR